MDQKHLYSTGVGVGGGGGVSYQSPKIQRYQSGQNGNGNGNALLDTIAISSNSNNNNMSSGGGSNKSSIRYSNDSSDHYQHQHHHNNNNDESIGDEDSYDFEDDDSNSNDHHNHHHHHSNDDDNQQHQQHIIDFQQLKNSSYSPQDKQYWRTRLNSGLFAIVFLECLFIFTYVPYFYYFTAQSKSIVASALILLIYHAIMFLVQFSLFRTTFTDPGGIPNGFPQSIFSEHENLLYETNSQGQKRKCSKCLKMKPDRTHHCSKCKRCVLKMDHHCPFVNNCNDENIFVGVVFVIALIFGLGLSVFTMTHFSYVFKNVTTIEHMEKKLRFSKQSTTNNSLFDVGHYHNWCQVFGYTASKWFLPVPPSYALSSGMIFPVNCSEDSPLMGF
ncbi:hypothetical protein PPL_11819 [Heterostelium album PN500]|uniref:Palmitoyltransferase n=1 Tax=Heterostelium pallidum (strain ATCC 26659 / Pp 5 / PN500) TaxID=670386 RepID=D3BUJ8_HETP5|nr:hypothetical protein PPL_11819 [Heterostelium album PN500]EFA74786.1 hypothetical protein PPL_11819 [Heterostelium album PN500]|eukprot:XP_020426920.1 hypothetical protein PPL_11819 [Heterostelium album PN500]